MKTFGTSPQTEFYNQVDMTSKIANQRTCDLCEQKELLIRGVLNVYLDRLDWSLSDITARMSGNIGQFGVETYSIDGVNLIEFHSPIHAVDNNSDMCKFNSKLPYKVLFKGGEQ